MSILPGNPYGTATNASPHEGEGDGDWAIAQATLALAYEQRTANLIALHQMSVSAILSGGNIATSAENLLRNSLDIETRLGLGENNE